jgi:hypothetical protein
MPRNQLHYRPGLARRRRGLALLIGCASVAAGLLTMVGSASAQARPDFKLPLTCGQVGELTTYVGHAPDDKKLDIYRVGGTTQGSAVRASAPGRVHEFFWPGGVEIDHGGGWFTVYLHMQNISVYQGQWVGEGQQIGQIGMVGTEVAHLHYEQLYDYNGDHDGETDEMVYPVIQGREYRLDPRSPASFPTVLSRNGCGATNPIGLTKLWVDTFATANGYNSPWCLTATPSDYCKPNGQLDKGTSYVFCRQWGDQVGSGGAYNRWWMITDLDRVYAGRNGRSYVSAYYLSRWGNDEARDNGGRNLPDCY